MIMVELTNTTVAKILESIASEDDLQPYKDLGDGLYKLPGNIITNKKGLDLYLETLRNKIKDLTL